MTQVVSNRTGREKIITAEGENTEFSVQVKKQKNFLRVRPSIKLSKEHRPDLLLSKGVPPEVIEESKKKMRSINSAWDQVQKLKN